MNVRRWGARLAVFVLAGVLPFTPAQAQERKLPSQTYESLVPASAVPVETLPAVDAAALRAEDRTSSTGPYRYGRTISTDYRPGRDGTWEQLPSGRWLWRLRIQSDDAVSMSVGFSTFDLPPDASLYVHGPGQTVVRGPYTKADATDGRHWTPLVRTDALILELEVAPGQRSAVNLVVGRVVHGYRPLPARGGAKSGSCNLDVACPEADPWRQQVQAVGGYTLQRGSNHLFCTGALVNSTAQNPRLLFLTAEHCVQTPNQAASMVFYWNFQTAQCRRPGTPENGTFPRDSLSVGAWDQTSSGAVLRARYGSAHDDGDISGKPDLTLVEVDDRVPARYDLFLSGWSRDTTATDESITVHHPRGHAKRISFDRDPTRITGYGQSSAGDTHLRIGNWETGTTEKGSSGAPLFDSEGHTVGVLSGGFAGCGGDGDADDNDQPDWYGRLAAGFNQGDYQNTTFAEWLDPAGTGAMSIQGQPLAAPARPANFRVASVSSQTVTLRWTAPGSNNMTGTAAKYLLRRASAPIQSQADFDSARSVSNVPPPQPAGTPQSVTVPVAPNTSYYFGLVAVDQAKNASPVAVTTRDATPVTTLRVLRPPSPNPTRARSTIHFVVQDRQTMQVSLYDPLGRRLRVLFEDEVRPFRRQRVTTNLSSLPSGLYFVRLRGPSTARTERVVVVR
ncbi:MAG: T9SS type A sorting domain-containing protein [Salinibacter sp.]